MPFLVDTDWVIHSLRGRADIRAKLDELSIDGLAISIISLAELFEGVYYAHDPIGSQAILGRFLQGGRCWKSMRTWPVFLAANVGVYESCTK